MMNASLNSIAVRAQKVADLFGRDFTAEIIIERLNDNGIPNNDIGLMKINSDMITTQLLTQIIGSEWSWNGTKYSVNIVDATLAASYLKGIDPMEKKPQTLVETIGQPQYTMSVVPLSVQYASMSDEALLEAYIRTGDDESKHELEKKSKGRHFIVLDANSNIDVTQSVAMLKQARKAVTPSMVRSANNTTLTRLLTIGEYHHMNVVFDESPFRKNVALFNGSCPVTNTNVGELTQEHRQFIRLLAESKNFNVAEEHAFVWVTSTLGQLMSMYPSVQAIFLELQRRDELPKLKLYGNSASTSVKADPFSPRGGK